MTMRQAIALFFVVSLFVGCSGSPVKPPPAVAQVSGTVLLDGSPMSSGQVTFTAPGQPPKSVDVKDGKFAGEVHAGKNLVEVTSAVDAPNPMDPKGPPVKRNKVAGTYQGPSSPLKADVPESGKADLKFEVKTGR